VTGANEAIEAMLVLRDPLGLLGPWARRGLPGQPARLDLRDLPGRQDPLVQQDPRAHRGPPAEFFSLEVRSFALRSRLLAATAASFRLPRRIRCLAPKMSYLALGSARLAHCSMPGFSSRASIKYL